MEHVMATERRRGLQFDEEEEQQRISSVSALLRQKVQNLQYTADQARNADEVWHREQLAALAPIKQAMLDLGQENPPIDTYDELRTFVRACDVLKYKDRYHRATSIELRLAFHTSWKVTWQLDSVDAAPYYNIHRYNANGIASEHEDTGYQSLEDCLNDLLEVIAVAVRKGEGRVEVLGTNAQIAWQQKLEEDRKILARITEGEVS